MAKQFTGQVGERGKIIAFQDDFTAFAPGGNALALVVIDRMTVAAAAGYANALVAAGNCQCRIEPRGNAVGQFCRIIILILGIQAHAQ